MATWETAWKVLAALPGTEQGRLHDNPAVRVRGRLVAYLPNNPRSRPAHSPDHEEFLVVRCDLAERAALLAEDPETFKASSGSLDWTRKGVTGSNLVAPNHSAAEQGFVD